MRAPLQRCAAGHHEPATVPPVVQDVLGAPGQPLDAGTRAFMEPRFGHDFSQVRVHTDARAAQSARTVNALAYTVGHNVVFGAGQYAPATSTGRRLLAHELTHTLQQRTAPALAPACGVTSVNDPTEHEANIVADQIMSGAAGSSITAQPTPLIMRKIVVDNPAVNIPNPSGKGRVQSNAATVQDYLTMLCPTGSVKVDAGTGLVSISGAFCAVPPLAKGTLGPPSPSAAQSSKTPTGCGCLCDLVKSAHTWTIQVNDGNWPQTNFDDNDAALGKKPGGSGGTVTTPSPNSPKLWGAGTASGKTLDIDPWLVLGHELCGHGWLGDSGSAAADETAPRGEGGHQETVRRENLLRAEHGIDLRGTFKDPHCGESYWRDKAAPGTVNWSSFHSVCETWRADYNKKHGTSYKITDKIP